MTAVPRRRPPTLWVFLLALTIVLGIGSRRHGDSLPGFVATYAGDTLWATAAFLGLGLLLPRASTGRIASLSLLVSALVEVSQFYHAPWIDSIRRTTPGALLLGHGFLWSDLVCYAVGVALGVGVEVGVGVLLVREGRPMSHPADRTQDRQS